MLKFRTFLRMILKILSDGVIRIITIISRPNEHARILIGFAHMHTSLTNKQINK